MHDPAPATGSSAHDAPFYVGYLPLPGPIRRFLWPWLVANGVLLLAVGVVLAQQQRDPGDGTWDTSRPVTLTGSLTADPYPLLCVPDPQAPHGMRTYILTRQSKTGVGDLVEGHDGHAVTVTGYVIARDGRHVLEIDETRDAPIRRADSAERARSVQPPVESLGDHTLVGEIVDPKCYLGAMKPGDGKPHKVCATLCITGGIPPVFVVRDERGHTTCYLLTTQDGGAFPPSHYGYIADPVEVFGRVERHGDLLVLRAHLASIRRLD